MTFGPLNLVIVQATSFCNLDCGYCYLPDRQLRKQITIDTVSRIFSRVFESPYVGDGFTVCWHAGEPLAMPPAFYREAFAAVDRARIAYGRHECYVAQSLQTNATLITQAWCDLFREFNVEVGVSLDGPAAVHDAHRKYRSGLGSHAAAMRGIALLQENGVPFNVIAVVSDYSLDHPDEIFDFFRDAGIRDVGFNMEEKEGVNADSSLGDRPATDERYRAFMQRMWDRTAAEGGEFRLREFEALASIAYNGHRLEQTDMNAPFKIVNFDHAGNFSTFDPELLSVAVEPYGTFAFGNVATDSLESIVQTPKFARAHADMQAGVDRCRATCDYFGVCGGGAGSNKYWENGTFNSTQTQACRYRTQILTDIVLAELEQAVHL
jgi:uncharacterized protein